MTFPNPRYYFLRVNEIGRAKRCLCGWGFSKKSWSSSACRFPTLFLLPSLIKIPVRKGACRFPTQRIPTQRRQQTSTRSQKNNYTKIDLHEDEEIGGYAEFNNYYDKEDQSALERSTQTKNLVLPNLTHSAINPLHHINPCHTLVNVVSCPKVGVFVLVIDIGVCRCRGRPRSILF